MGIVESTICYLFRRSAPVKTEAQQRQRTAAILRPIVDSAIEVADCIIDQNEQKANDSKTASPDR